MLHAATSDKLDRESGTSSEGSGCSVRDGDIYCCESDSVVHEAKKFDFPGIKFLGEFPHRAAHKAPALVTFSSLLLTANRFSSQQ